MNNMIYEVDRAKSEEELHIVFRPMTKKKPCEVIRKK